MTTTPTMRDAATEASEILRDLIANVEAHGLYSQESMLGFIGSAHAMLRTALAAPADALAEPVATVYTMEALVPGGSVKYHATVHKPLPAGTKLYTAPPATQFQQAVARALAERDADTSIWAVNVQGPDDLYPCESRLAALEMANTLNTQFIAMQEKDHHEYDPIMRAVVIPWEFSAEEHAAAIRAKGQ